MARRKRFHLPNATYHVMLRGNDGQPIFFSDEDKCHMCLLIQEGIERFGHSIYSFCFMSNHIHLAVQVRDISISHIIQNLAFRYTRYINSKLNRIGHLFQGRFRSILVDGNQYLKELIRYIHLNPVRAHLVDHPEQYIWSSHRAYLLVDEFTWLNRDHLLKTFDSNRNEAILIYEQFILKGIGIESELNFKSGCFKGILGNQEFVNEVLEITKETQKIESTLNEIVAKVCERYKISETSLRSLGKQRLESHARSVLALIVRNSKNLSLEELANFLDRDPSGLSKLARRLENKCSQSKTLLTEINELYEGLVNHTQAQMSECLA